MIRKLLKLAFWAYAILGFIMGVPMVAVGLYATDPWIVAISLIFFAGPFLAAMTVRYATSSDPETPESATNSGDTT